LLPNFLDVTSRYISAAKLQECNLIRWWKAHSKVIVIEMQPSWVSFGWR
jgi:hypothetical protein